MKFSIRDIENILRVAYDTAKSCQTRSNLKAEIEELKQIKTICNTLEINDILHLNHYQNILTRIIN